MRFLCDQCKAKYQISDDKVAGKTVRMKCRKCGHMIEVRAEVTETSVNARVSEAPAAVAAGAVAAKPGAKPAPPRKLATSLTSTSAPRPHQAAHTQGALAGAFQRNVAASPTGSMRPPAGPDDSSALDMLSASANPWYVAINGVPVGPVRLSELRKKAAAGLVTDASLVWQEGLEEWRPVKTFPELSQLVREAASSGRPSLVSPPPAERASHLPPSPAGAPQQARQAPRAPMAPRAATPMPAPAGRSNVVPIGSRLPQGGNELDFGAGQQDATRVDPNAGAAAEAALMGMNARASVAPDPFAAPAPASPQAAASPFAPTVNPFAPTVQAPSPAAVGVVGASASRPPAASIAPSPSMAAIAVPQQKREVNYFGIAMIAVAVAFGVTAAVVAVPMLLKNRTAAPVASASAVSTGVAAPSTTVASGDLPPVPTADATDTAPTSSSTPEHVAAAGGHSTGGGKPASTGSAKAVDPSIADLLRGGSSGPSAGAGGSGASGGGGSSLSAGEIEAVVNNRKVGVTRTCWERNNGNLSSANVTCHVTIAGNGTVSSSQAEGSDPVVAKCIEQQVKSWTFPPSGGSTQVNLPFHFVRQ